MIGHPFGKVARAPEGSSPIRRPPPIARRVFLGLLPTAIGWRPFYRRRKGQDAKRPAAGLDAPGAAVAASIKDVSPAEVAVAYHDLANGEELLIRADET